MLLGSLRAKRGEFSCKWCRKKGKIWHVATKPFSATVWDEDDTEQSSMLYKTQPKLTLTPPVMQVFLLKALWRVLTSCIHVWLFPRQQKTSSTHRTRWSPYWLSLWLLSLLPCYQMEPVSTGSQSNHVHILCMNRWAMGRWVIQHGTNMQQRIYIYIYV